jgi:superkiller protein 3
MKEVFKSIRLFLGLVCLIFSPLYSFGQDLGSSTGIFRSSNPSSTKKTSPVSPKKNTTKNTATVVSRKKENNPSSKTVKSSSGETKGVTNRNKSKIKTRRETVVESKSPPQVVTQPVPQNNVIITVGVNNEELFEKAIEEGNAARDSRDYQKADAAYRRAFGINPRDSRAIYGLGNVYADQQRWEEAEQAYRQAIQIEPDNASAYIALSYVLTQPIIGADLSERYSEAERSVRRAIQIDPQNAFAYDQLGVTLELRGIISQEAENAYRKAIQIEPEFALAYAHLGRFYRRLGKINESAEAYRKAIQYSTDVPTMILVADVMQSQQRYLESEQLLRRALKEDPKNPTALYLLGRALTTRNSFEEAEKVLKKSLEISPKSLVAYILLSSLYQRRARLDEAEKVLEESLKIVSQNERKRLAREFEILGDAFLQINKPKNAHRLYQQALALDSNRAGLAEKISKTR